MTDVTEIYDWGSLTWHHHAEANTLSGTMEIAAGKSCGKHMHDNANEVIVVVNGTATLHLSDEAILMKPGTSHHVPAGETHELHTELHSPATVLIIFDNPNRNYLPL